MVSTEHEVVRGVILDNGMDNKLPEWEETGKTNMPNTEEENFSDN